MVSGTRWGVVFDCDGTLFEKRFISLMRILDVRALSAEHQREMQEMREQFLELANSNRLTYQEEVNWLEWTLDIYIRAGLTADRLRTAMAEVKPRRGVRRCLRLLSRAGVPVGIVSYGGEQLIRAVLEANGVNNLVDDVYAARLLMDDSGRFVGYDRDSYVLPGNKDVWSRRFAQKHGISDDRLLAVGDSAADAKLGILQENRLGIAENEAQGASIRPFMGEVAVSMDFTPVTDWLLKKIGTG
jgi:HAD superfamily phosphoserine phosphatase-like hydrolase